MVTSTIISISKLPSCSQQPKLRPKYSLRVCIIVCAIEHLYVGEQWQEQVLSSMCAVNISTSVCVMINYCTCMIIIFMYTSWHETAIKCYYSCRSTVQDRWIQSVYHRSHCSSLEQLPLHVQCHTPLHSCVHFHTHNCSVSYK